ncbi:methylated-DNA--[protein]-cysteine S-methyltransferase [Nonomuraea sp. NPDC050451]|uniref:methylated-DNA--[protein]-cysteine S-methyltransferase n=1 Tax=Nonomuraea sp. NPDC050451 TaxID=3364364 RepID=UPI0037AC676D
MMTVYTVIDSPIDALLLVGERRPSGFVLTAVRVGEDHVQAGWRRVPEAFAAVERQLREYFAGERTTFDLTISGGGTPFQERVWAAIDAVPYGSTTTYGKLAEEVDAPRDRIRAVAAAVGANPLLVIRPCHRVIGADGSLTGYAGGVERKHLLLAHEGALQPLFL